ncbi:putative RNA-binding Zn ribbon-like protein [Saccharothrix coeruleofusca]|uniref:CGNR zinc finger domain-containing protein n=1 Tax=Saccharothrix coeruleofusca TaxID=33919 RepID=UPI001AEA1F0A|nr:CGNR zinc finger domain-containing protein [Saccharothrix coeruleofusca]MBP2340661.1 putative RNA-binding Zn ribbon-like protein [Saccharothrix coeruleofusca]
MLSLKVVEDFLNTLDERTFTRHGESHVPGERLTSPRALADWLAAHDLSSGDTPLRTADVEAAIALRTALRQALVVDAETEVEVASALRDYPLRLVPDASGGLRIAAASGRPWLDAVVETVAGSAARGDWARVKLCAAPDCRWAFYDTSRNGRGRWCAMEICGNRHKTRTYRERRHHGDREASPRPPS